MSLNQRTVAAKPLDERSIQTSEPPARPDHLTNAASGPHMRPITPREWVCVDCEHRITQSPRGKHEYGHDRQCDHSIHARRE